MALNIKNPEVERLAAEVASITKESKTEAVRQALQERKERLALEGKMSKRERLQHALETKIWPKLPPEMLGKKITKQEREEILGYGPDGV